MCSLWFLDEESICVHYIYQINDVEFNYIFFYLLWFVFCSTKASCSQKAFSEVAECRVSGARIKGM